MKASPHIHINKKKEKATSTFPSKLPCALTQAGLQGAADLPVQVPPNVILVLGKAFVIICEAEPSANLHMGGTHTHTLLRLCRVN